MTAAAVAALGFCAFMPYPALPLGNATAVQMGNVLVAVMALPFVTLAWDRRALAVYPLLLAPLAVAVLKVALLDGGGDVSLSLKSVSVWAASCLAIVVVQIYGPAYALDLMTGMAVATLVHAAVGAWQFVAFSGGEFPLVGLYVNPSFLSVQDNARTIARYTRRPFGLFPEPSAMASCLAPWVLFWAAELAGVVRLRREPAAWQRALFGAAAAGGLGLILLSQSGHGAVTVVGLLLIVAVWFVRCRATAGAFALIAALSCVLLPAVLWFAAVSLSGRLGGADMGNSSWEERSTSLKIGLSLLVDGDPSRALLGMGPGLVSPALWNAARIDAVFSVLLTYVYETGLVGMGVVGWLGYYLLRVWRSLRMDLTFATFGAVWLVGVTLTTSYEQLLPLWIALGWLTIWPAVCRSPAVRADAVRVDVPPQAPALRRLLPARAVAAVLPAVLRGPGRARWSDGEPSAGSAGDYSAAVPVGEAR
jgi:hypothetical protein